MSSPYRTWEPPQSCAAGSIGRSFVFAESMDRDPDEFTTLDHYQELLAPLLVRLRQGDVPAALRTATRLRHQRPDLALMYPLTGSLRYLHESKRVFSLKGLSFAESH